jgi:hypothetical protein
MAKRIDASRCPASRRDKNLEQDDVTAVLFKVEDTKPRLQDNLAAPVRVFQRAAINENL